MLFPHTEQNVYAWLSKYLIVSMGILGDDNPAISLFIFSHRMRFPAVTGGLFLPQYFSFNIL